jgi:rhodanese-related sulfurtransferase
MTEPKMPVWSPAELHRHLNERSRFAILDVRNRSEFDVWKIEGKVPIQTINIPYYDLLDLQDENEELATAVARAVPERLKDSLPRSGPILAVCARGETSPHVAEGLRRLGYQAFNLEGGMAAWGDHYEMRVVEESQQLTILQISRPARG